MTARVPAAIWPQKAAAEPARVATTPKRVATFIVNRGDCKRVIRDIVCNAVIEVMTCLFGKCLCRSGGPFIVF